MHPLHTTFVYGPPPDIVHEGHGLENRGGRLYTNTPAKPQPTEPAHVLNEDL
ncbi:unnamed protein product, partial [Larinioides sclopetarius]